MLRSLFKHLLLRCVRPYFDLPGFLQFIGQQHAFRVIDIDHHRLQTWPVKQGFFGLPILVHIAVVIQMVLREIGKHSQAHMRAI